MRADSKRSSMGKRPPRNGTEQDAFTGWRHVLCYLSRAGAVSSIKHAANRRDRRKNRAELSGWAKHGGLPSQHH